MTTYPPLASLDDYPLHGWSYGGAEYACERPEDPNCRQYDWRCDACVLAATAVIAQGIDPLCAWRENASSPERPVRLSWLVARSNHWRERGIGGAS